MCVTRRRLNDRETFIPLTQSHMCEHGQAPACVQMQTTEEEKMPPKGDLKEQMMAKIYKAVGGPQNVDNGVLLSFCHDGMHHACMRPGLILMCAFACDRVPPPSQRALS